MTADNAPGGSIHPASESEIAAAMGKAYRDQAAYQAQGTGQAVPDPRTEDQKLWPVPPDRYLSTQGDAAADQ